MHRWRARSLAQARCYLAHRDTMQLSDAQLAEVGKRRTDPDRKLVPHAEAKERLGRLRR